MKKNQLDKEKINKISKKNAPDSVTDQPFDTEFIPTYNDKNQVRNIKKYLADRYEFRLNIVSHELEYRPIGENDYQILNESDIAIELMENDIIKSDRILKIVLGSSLIEHYNPVTTYFDSLPVHNPGEEDHIAKLATFVETDDRKWFTDQFRKFLVRAVRCVYTEHFNKQMLLFVGKQNDGKTTFLRFLCPDKLKNYYKDDLEFGEKDAKIAICRNFMINIDELAGFDRKEINKAKALMSMANIKERLPYGARETRLKRIASFVGSTNNTSFLKDSTGSVRYLIFKVNKIRHDKGGDKGYQKNVNIDNVWSQAVTLFKNGFKADMTPQDNIRSQTNNRLFQEIVSEGEVLEMFLKPGRKKDPGAEFKTFTKIKEYLEEQNSLRHNTHRLSESLTFHGFEMTSERIENSNPIKGYWIIKKKKS